MLVTWICILAGYGQPKIPGMSQLAAIVPLSGAANYDSYLGARNLALLSDDGSRLHTYANSFHVLATKTGKPIGSDLIKVGLVSVNPPRFASRSVSQFSNTGFPKGTSFVTNGKLLAATDGHFLASAEIRVDAKHSYLGVSDINLKNRGAVPNVDALVAATSKLVRSTAGSLLGDGKARIATFNGWSKDRSTVTYGLYALSGAQLRAEPEVSAKCPPRFGAKWTWLDPVTKTLVVCGSRDLLIVNGDVQTVQRFPWTALRKVSSTTQEWIYAWPIRDGVLVSRLVASDFVGSDELYLFRMKEGWTKIGPYGLAARSANGKHWVVGDRKQWKFWLVTF